MQLHSAAVSEIYKKSLKLGITTKQAIGIPNITALITVRLFIFDIKSPKKNK